MNANLLAEAMFSDFVNELRASHAKIRIVLCNPEMQSLLIARQAKLLFLLEEIQNEIALIQKNQRPYPIASASSKSSQLCSSDDAKVSQLKSDVPQPQESFCKHPPSDSLNSFPSHESDISNDSASNEIGVENDA